MRLMHLNFAQGHFPKLNERKLQSINVDFTSIILFLELKKKAECDKNINTNDVNFKFRMVYGKSSNVEIS